MALYRFSKSSGNLAELVVVYGGNGSQALLL